jgi:hypothetical protein
MASTSRTVSRKRELSRRGKQPSTYRRIVTGNVDSKSIIQSDDQVQPEVHTSLRGEKLDRNSSTRRVAR